MTLEPPIPPGTYNVDAAGVILDGEHKGLKVIGMTAAGFLQTTGRENFKQMAPTMTGAEYAKVIATLGLNQVESARFLGVDDRTVRRWIAEQDQPIVPAPVSMLLRIMAHYKIDPRIATTIRP